MKKNNQQGAALLIVMLILIVSLLYSLVNNFPSGNHHQKYIETQESLAIAKNALIGRALNWPEIDNKTVGDSIEGPGRLPCPDTDGDSSIVEWRNGTSEGICSNLNLGYLPFKTLKINDLRDSYGEKFWYVVADEFKNNPSQDFNGSNTTTSIRVDGRDNIVAIIIAPNKVIDGKERVHGSNNKDQYLDDENSNENGDFVTTMNEEIGKYGEYDNGALVFNDQLAVISMHDIMQVLEKRVLVEYTHILEKFYEKNGFLPWLADFDAFDVLDENKDVISKPDNRKGLLDLNNPNDSRDSFLLSIIIHDFHEILTGENRSEIEADNLTTDISNIHIDLECRSNNNDIEDISCLSNAVGNSKNNINYYYDNIGLKLSDFLNHSGKSFDSTITDGYLMSDKVLTIQDDINGTLYILANGNDIKYCYKIDFSDKAIYKRMSSPSDSDLNDCVTTEDSFWDGPIAFVYFRVSILSHGFFYADNETNYISEWLYKDKWYQQIYVAYSDGYQIGGTADCNELPSPNCLKVDNNSVAALVMSSGVALPAQDRASSNDRLNNYFEGINAIDDNEFETKKIDSNDQLRTITLTTTPSI